MLRTRTKKIPGSKSHYLVCDVMSKAGPGGGKTVCHKKAYKKGPKK